MRLPSYAIRRLGCCLVLLASTAASGAPPLKNWFNDPFFQVRDRIANCPRPLGPFIAETDMKLQEHSRVERGTSCWLAGKCKKPNAYMYDADIGKDLQRRFAQSRRFADASLWITVQRRFVYVEGCVHGKVVVAGIEAFVKQTPDVELVIQNTIVGTRKPNYPVMPKSSAIGTEFSPFAPSG
ncbi:BON domain-containing protein [Paludibacterium sp.]|uniref:BON domain-containing protein n=1 Tax=Paludibacterium sp. TaxID=1917523 RepID=UPI0025EDBA2A|nr:BON domain-containing protein [Paludibacterium sp.]MBV8647757.1 BON domain-containing protein [Paludibacterium sp.]